MKKIIALCLAAIIALAIVGCGQNEETATITEETVSEGDIITFGSYEQDNDSSNGKEPLEWLVLAKTGDTALVISRYSLDCQQFNETSDDVTWETCSLRKWLNGSFINNAFSTEEQKEIQNTTLAAGKNPSYSTPAGNSTTDKVFLLSVTEVNKYFSSDESRKCAPTDYAIAQGALARDDYKIGGRATSWWLLRTPGYNSRNVAFVDIGGVISDTGYSVSENNWAIRPALSINLG